SPPLCVIAKDRVPCSMPRPPRVDLERLQRRRLPCRLEKRADVARESKRDVLEPSPQRRSEQERRALIPGVAVVEGEVGTSNPRTARASSERLPSHVLSRKDDADLAKRARLLRRSFAAREPRRGVFFDRAEPAKILADG